MPGEAAAAPASFSDRDPAPQGAHHAHSSQGRANRSQADRCWRGGQGRHRSDSMEPMC